MTTTAPVRVDFNSHIRPILSDRCFQCHGPDENSRKAGLRLDLPQGAQAVLDEKSRLRVVTPHNLEKSELWQRITTEDPDDLMPPPKSKLALDPGEIALIRKWIEQGAEYKAHWSFLPITKPRPPKTGRNGPRHPIDAFVLDRLEREGLRPAPEASKETLIRRLSFDLTGLPPSIGQIDAFLNDTSPKAYEKLADRLLASPAYGERMANLWLDLARYADTYGYQSDVESDLSPWRDWVIRAFNGNLPYDQFVTWQIAGDLLPRATDEQILATAFNRLHRQTNEGGSIEEEFRAEYVADRVHTMGTAFLGMTFECARCHDHKYDPISQRDYYSLFAFFNNIDESGLYSHFTRATPFPSMLLYEPGVKEKHLALKRRIAEKEAELARLEKQNIRRGKVPEPHPPSPIAVFSFDEITGNTTPGSVGEQNAELVEAPQSVEGHAGRALQFSGENSVVCKGVGEFKRTDPFSFRLWLKPAEPQERAVIFHRSRAWTDSGSRGYELILENGRPTFALIHFWPGNAIAIRAREALPLNEWTHLTLTYDGSSRASGLRIYQNGQLLPVEIVRDNLFKDILHRAEWGDSDVGKIHLTLAARFRDSGFRNGLIDEFEVFDDCLTPAGVHALASLPGGPPDGWTPTAELKQLRDEENDLVNGIREIMVMKEMPQRRPAFVLNRGAYDAPGDPVSPATPGSILPFSSRLPKDRLGLARWLTDPRNPLTARVAVNRLWQIHFGRGLVATPEDFGSQGELPAHPELLDWLAKTFMDSGWNLKAMHKTIVTSATYRQSSVAPAEVTNVDPDNRLLARGPKHRLHAEQIRDAALAVSGLLSDRIGGPSVKPYQPAGLWEQSGLAKSYAPDKGEGLYRRSLYTFWRRTSPPPSMTTFDAVSREVCTARRESTATPLQALVLLNDPQFVEAARVLAGRLVRDVGDVRRRIEQAFRMITGRQPQEREMEILRRLYEEQLSYFIANPTAAPKLLAIGEHPRDETLAINEVAATAVLASTLLNHDEFVMKR